MNYEHMVSMLIMLNPFALFLYLKDVMGELDSRDFYKVLLKASFISYVIFFVFAVFGRKLFLDVFQISFESFRIFGGIILFAYAYFYIIPGAIGVDMVARGISAFLKSTGF